MMTSCLLLAGALTLGGCAECARAGLQDDPEYEWRKFSFDPGRSYLYRAGVPIAGYDHAHKIYRTYDADSETWGLPETPPWLSDQAKPMSTEARVPNFGIDVDKLNGADQESFGLNGRSISRAQAQRALTALPDDADRLRLTVIGSDDETRHVAADLAGTAELQAWRERLVLQTYPPEHWAVARSGFVNRGRPTIYVQAPDGQVLHRQDDYSDGADGLARALRRADPNYDSKKDPDLRRPLWLRRLDWSLIPVPVWILTAGFLFVLWRGRSSR